ncbi:head-tail connector protein [bacterium]|jgi:uncharacterized phage protein (predicted DNA packaging)|nr:head-tail connector protein [bacterium]
MTIITLETAKLHLKVDTTDDDAMIEIYLGAAERAAMDYCNRTIYGAEGVGSDLDGVVINDAIKAAILLNLGHLYVNREGVDTVQKQELPLGIQSLLQPYRIGIGM